MIAGAVLPLAKTGEAAKSGPIGLAVILILCIVCYFLFKSMSKQMRKVREGFPVGSTPVAGSSVTQPTLTQPTLTQPTLTQPTGTPADAGSRATGHVETSRNAADTSRHHVDTTPDGSTNVSPSTGQRGQDASGPSNPGS